MKAGNDVEKLDDSYSLSQYKVGYSLSLVVS